MVITVMQLHLRSPSPSWERSLLCHGLASTQQGSPLLQWQCIPAGDSPVHAGADHGAPTLGCGAATSHRVSASPPKPMQYPWFWGAGIFSLPSRNWVLHKHFLSVWTPNSSQPQVWGSKDSKGGMKLKNMHLHCDCKVLGDSLKEWDSRDGNCSLDYRWENYFGEYHSCTKPSILIFKNMGE